MRSGRTSGTTTQTDTCSRHNPDKSQGRPNEKPGLKAHRANRPTRLRSPNKAPVPDRSTLRPDPDRAFTEHFHAARCATPPGCPRMGVERGCPRGLFSCAGPLEVEARADAALQERAGEAGREGVRGLPACAMCRHEEVGRQFRECVTRGFDERLEMGTVEMKATDHRVQVRAA